MKTKKTPAKAELEKPIARHDVALAAGYLRGVAAAMPRMLDD